MLRYLPSFPPLSPLYLFSFYFFKILVILNPSNFVFLSPVHEPCQVVHRDLVVPDPSASTDRPRPLFHYVKKYLLIFIIIMSFNQEK